MQVEWECTFHSLWNRHAWTLCSQAKKKWSETLWSYVYLHGKQSHPYWSYFQPILASMLKTHGKSLDDESLLTLMFEVEGILNPQDLTVKMINDPGSFQPLSPANILTKQSKLVMLPLEKFLRPDLFCRRRWRQLPHIANKLWFRWKKEYLESLQERQK